MAAGAAASAGMAGLTAVIATTGKCGRELFTLADRRQHLYQVGSMGGATGMALGVAFSTRPLSGFSVGAIAGICLVYEMTRRRFAGDAWRGALALVIGGLLGALPALRA